MRRLKLLPNRIVYVCGICGLQSADRKKVKACEAMGVSETTTIKVGDRVDWRGRIKTYPFDYSEEKYGQEIVEVVSIYYMSSAGVFVGVGEIGPHTLMVDLKISYEKKPEQFSLIRVAHQLINSLGERNG